MTSLSRPNSVEIDAKAFADNLTSLRSALRPGTEIWQVCKGDGYGMGTVRAAKLGAACSINRFCAGTPDEALALRDAFPKARILLFPSAAAEDLPALAAQGITLTIHNGASLDELAAKAPQATCWLKLDTGLHRFGFDSHTWSDVLAKLRHGALPGLEGVYTHFGQTSDPDRMAASLAFYDTCLAAAREATGRRLFSMVAASPTLLMHPALPYDFVDPGRALYGMLPPDQCCGIQLCPVVRSIRSRLLDSRALDPGGSVGYGAAGRGSVKRVGVFPIGHFDGLSAQGPLGTVLIRGTEVPVLARTLLSSIVDLTSVPDAQDGNEITLVGHSLGVERDIHAFADCMNSSATLVHFGLVHALPKFDTKEN